MIGLILRLSALVIAGAMFGTGNVTVALLGVALACWVFIKVPAWLDKLNGPSVPPTPERVKAAHDEYRRMKKGPTDSKWNNA